MALSLKWYNNCFLDVVSTEVVRFKVSKPTLERWDQLCVKVDQYLEGYRMQHMYRKLENPLCHGRTKINILLNISPNRFKIDCPGMVSD